MSVEGGDSELDVQITISQKLYRTILKIIKHLLIFLSLKIINDNFESEIFKGH